MATIFEDMRAIENLLGTTTRAQLPESAAYASFDRFCDECERALGIGNIDGHEDRDGYSLDTCHSAWLANFTVAEYTGGKRTE